MGKKLISIGIICALACGCACIFALKNEKTHALTITVLRVLSEERVISVEELDAWEVASVHSGIWEGVGMLMSERPETVKEIEEPCVPKALTKVDDVQGEEPNDISQTQMTAPQMPVTAPQVTGITVPEVVENEWDVVEPKDDVVYAKESVSIKDYPSMSAPEVAVVRKGDELRRVGICRNGWSQVNFYEQSRYCSSDCLSDEKVRKSLTVSSPDNANDVEFPACDGRLGDMGRLMIPDVGYSVALFNGSGMGEAYAQSLVDAEDSADYECCTGCSEFIADHSGQGFDKMKNSVPGTMAYVYWANGTCTAYKCVAIHYNAKWRYNGGESVDENGIPITKAGYDLTMQTCNSDDGSVIMVSYWDRM